MIREDCAVCYCRWSTVRNSTESSVVYTVATHFPPKLYKFDGKLAGGADCHHLRWVVELDYIYIPAGIMLVRESVTLTESTSFCNTFFALHNNCLLEVADVARSMTHTMNVIFDAMGFESCWGSDGRGMSQPPHDVHKHIFVSSDFKGDS